jgi:hypothetical protein
MLVPDFGHLAAGGQLGGSAQIGPAQIFGAGHFVSCFITQDKTTSITRNSITAQCVSNTLVNHDPSKGLIIGNPQNSKT